MNILLKKINDFKKFTLNEKMMVITLISLFLPMHFSVVCLVVTLIIALYKKQLFNSIKDMPGAIFLYPFCVLAIIVSFIYKNYVGLLNALGFTLIFVFIAFYRTIINKKLFNYLMNLALFLSLVVAFVGVLEYKAYLDINDYSFLEVFMSEVPAKRLQVTFYNANFYAMMIEMFVIVAFYASYNTNNKKKKVYYIVIALVNMVMMYLTGCRTAFGAIAIAFLVFYLALGNKKLLKVSWVLFIVCAIIFITNPNLIPRFSELISALSLREEIWQGGIQIFTMHPLFGNGPQTYGLLSPTLGLEVAPHAHNIYIDTFCSYGIIGTLIFGGYMLNMFKDIYDLRKDKALFALSTSLIAIILVHGVFDVTLNYVSTGCFAMLVLNVAPILNKNSI